MIEKKKLISYLIILTVLFSVITPIGNKNKKSSFFAFENQEKIHLSATQSFTEQWIKNPNFTSTANWTSTKGILGDPTDVDASISGGQANFEVLGKKGRKEISDPINIANSGNWTAFNKTEPAINPDTYTIDNNGFYVSHSWHDATADQFASISWRYNVSMDIDMSDYIITSAFINSTMFADVDPNIDTKYDTYARFSPDYQIDQPGIFDHAFFFVEIADLDMKSTYRIAYNQTSDLGKDTAPTFYTIDTKSIEPVGDEEDLIYYLNRVFENDPDHDNFTIIIGIEISCEDDYTGTDFDDWNELRIQSLNLTFTYEKKIDQLTSISWNQDGEKPSDISNNTITVNEALFWFKYKINDTWSSLSPNSEIRILINDIPHSETVKLSTATISPQDAKSGGFDITSLIDEDHNINLSLQVYLADTFELNRTITISIDEVYLNITYTETFADIPSNLELFLNNINKTDDPVIALPLGENLNITIKYIVNQTGAHITNATVQLEGKVSGTLSENITLQQYTLMVNTSQLGIGVKILSVTAQKDVYEQHTIQFFVEITERATEIQLFIDGNQKNDGDTIQLEIDESINVTINYRDNKTKQHVSNATVNLIGIGTLNETNNQYNITINAQDLDQAITVLTIFAQLSNYQTQSILFFVEIIERVTELTLLLNNIPKNDGDTIQVELDDMINVTVFYKDNNTKAYLPNATIILVGRGTFNETGNQYNFTINAQDLDQGISVLKIFAQLMNYQTQSIQFFVEVVERSTELDLFLNSEDKTLDPVYSLTKGQDLNLTIKYTDNQTGQHINTGNVQLIGEGLLLNLTRDDILGQYYTILDTTTLGIGVKLFSIVAQATNYQIKTVDPRITINRIRATINTESGISQITVDVGEDVLLQLVLNDTIFGGTITNATVTYRWAYGQGELVDPDDDSIYEATLLNVQSGVYDITIAAFAGDDYNFESFEITLIVSQPTTQPRADLGWLVFVLIGAILGLVTIFIFYQTYFKYPPLVRKMRKIKKRIKKGRKTKPIMVSKREEISNKNFENQKKILESAIVRLQPDKFKEEEM